MKLKKSELAIEVKNKIGSFRSFEIITLISLILSFSSFFIIPFRYLLPLVAIGITTALYLFIHPAKKNLTGIRYIPYLKTFIVTAVWIGVVFILLFRSSYVVDKHFILFFTLAIIQIWISCVLFDLKDLVADNGKIKTIALLLGSKGFFFFWLLFVSILLMFPVAVLKINSAGLFLLITGAALQLFAIKKKSNYFLFIFLVDGGLLLWFISDYFLFNQ